jgi:hypothetical protein
MLLGNGRILIGIGLIEAIALFLVGLEPDELGLSAKHLPLGLYPTPCAHIADHHRALFEDPKFLH